MAAQTDRALDRARERFAVQDYYGTVHVLEEIVATGRAFADVHHLLGVSLSLLGQRERALAELSRALELNPRYLEALIHFGLVLSELGREAEAEDAFRRAASSVSPPLNGLPSPVASRLANHHAELAEAYAEAGALDRAVEEYRRALELGPTFVDLRYRMARLLLESGRSLEAREALEEVIRLRPNFLDALAALGLAHFLSGDALGAREIWRSCLSRRPENARVEAYLAMLGRTGA
ncbi:MAG TPA: tetratricopeptide repeat protein [Gemmatimonadales bacterium]|jgi:tetratricopeptide (TPR) repeat protein|nr:tetratricopeptide repeat protein [Gemmatimonadales bacterium]